MNILEFLSKFPTEQSCKDYLKELREKQGIICNKCGCKLHWWLNKIEKFQCCKCNSRTNLKAGTLMEKSKVPLQKWFMCIHLMTTTKKPFSCLELQRQLGIKKYETTQMLMNKVRLSMGNRDEKYKLKGFVEVDDAYFEVVDLPEVIKKDELGNDIDTKKLLFKEKFVQKCGVGSQGKQRVLVMVESQPRPQTNKYRKDREIGYVKMIVVKSIAHKDVNFEVRNHIDKDAHVISDDGTGLSAIGKEVKEHTPEKFKPGNLPWVHTMIANCKREFLGTHHSVSRTYLQNYLNEFCYKVNRRNFTTDLFDRMLISSVSDTWY